MKGIFRVIEVDGVTYPVRFRGFDTPMEVRAPNGEILTFLPWKYGDHMEALRLSLKFGPKGLELDVERFCRCVMNRSDVPEDYVADLGGVALWWAGGGDKLKNVSPPADGWLDLGAARVQLDGWSNEDRIRALAGSLIKDASGESLDVVRYLDAMVRASVRAFNPEMTLDDLDAGATATLITAVVSLNIPEELFLFDVFNGDAVLTREHARATLRLCTELGWTPSKVWKTPAAEVDRLLALLDRVQPEPSARSPRRPGLADYSDAVVIQFEDD